MNQLAPSTRLRVENQVAVVTGGAGGIGAGIVRRFVEEGARVVFSDLLADKGKALEGELGQDTAFYRADATIPSDCEALMNFAVERFGGLDCVVNNAGAGAKGGPIAGISVEGFDRAIALLLRGPFLGIKYAVPQIVAPWLAAGITLGKAGFPPDIANAALWLASSESSFVTGHALVVDGGLTSGVSWSRMLQGYQALQERCQAAMAETTVTS